jgi:hypothetical protein
MVVPAKAGTQSNRVHTLKGRRDSRSEIAWNIRPIEKMEAF